MAESALRFDLQAHSTHSDGSLPADAVVAAAAEAGAELLALSDHDTVAGVDEALRAGRRYGVDVVPAVEISALHGAYEDLHILGYGIDHRSPALLEALRRFRADRQARAERMAGALEEIGFDVDREALRRRLAAGASIGRPHLAAAVFDVPDNAARLAAEGLRTPVDVLRAYLIPGAPAYRGRTLPSVPEAIRTIHAAGGVAVWAHPFWDVEASAEVISEVDRFREDGLDGVEVFYTTHSREQIELLYAACRERGLLSTGSSDFHGPQHAVFSRFLTHDLHGLEPDLGPLPDQAQRAAGSLEPDAG